MNGQEDRSQEDSGGLRLRRANRGLSESPRGFSDSLMSMDAEHSVHMVSQQRVHRHRPLRWSRPIDRSLPRRAMFAVVNQMWIGAWTGWRRVMLRNRAVSLAKAQFECQLNPSPRRQAFDTSGRLIDAVGILGNRSGN
jgi:hypothetical protein